MITVHFNPLQPVLSRNLGQKLAVETNESGRTLSDVLRTNHGSLKAFLQKYPHVFTLGHHGGEMWEFSVSMNSSVVQMDTIDAAIDLPKDLTIAKLNDGEIDESYLLKVVLQVTMYEVFVASS